MYVYLSLGVNNINQYLQKKCLKIAILNNIEVILLLRNGSHST